MMIPGTFVSHGRDMFLETFKELGTKYGFMAYITYEDIGKNHSHSSLLGGRDNCIIFTCARSQCSNPGVQTNKSEKNIEC